MYGEDPYLSGRITTAYVKGMQGSHPRYFRANSGCKVVGLYSGPENRPVSRFSFNAVVSILAVFIRRLHFIAWLSLHFVMELFYDDVH